MKILAIGDFHGKFPRKLLKEAGKVDLILGVGDYAGIKEWMPYIKYVFQAHKKGEKIINAKEYFGKKFKALLKKDFEAGKKILSKLNNLKIPVIYIFGNGDDWWYKYPFDRKLLKAKKREINFKKKLKNMKEITYGNTKFNNIAFSGFGGYMDVDYYFEEDQKKKDGERFGERVRRREKMRKKLFSNLNKLKNKEKIFIFHYPPRNYFDVVKDKGFSYSGRRAGVNFFTQAIKKYKPSLVICGHMHEYQGKKRLGKTTIIATGAAYESKAALIELEKNKVKNVKFIR